MITQYEVTKWSNTIRAKEFERETTQFLVRKGGSKEGKNTEYSIFFPTQKQAETYLKNRLRLQIKLHQVELDAATERLRELESGVA